MAEPNDILITQLAALEEMQQLEAQNSSNSEAIDNVGKNVVNSSIYGVEDKPPKVKAALISSEKARLKNKMDVIVASWFTLKKKYEKDTKPKTVVSEEEEEGEEGMQLSEEDGKKKGKGLMDWISGLLGILGLGKFGKGGLTKMLGKWLWKGIKWAGSKIWGALKGVGKAAWGAIKAGFRGVGRAFSNLWKGFTSSGFWKTFTGAIGKGLSAAKGALAAAGSYLKNALASVGKAAQNTLSAVTGGAVPRATPKPPKPPRPSGGGVGGWFSKKFKQAKTAVVKSAQFIGEKAVKAKTAVVKVAKSTYQAGKTVVKSAVKLVGGPFRAAVKAAKDYFMKGGGKKGLRGVLKKIPFIGAAIEGVFAGFDINKYSKDREGTMEDLKTQIGARVIKGLGSTLVGGALAASLAGVPGGFILSPLGFMGGAYIGGMVAKWLTDAFPNAATGVGNFMLNMFPGLVANKKAAMAAGDEEAVRKKELQDFIMLKGGTVIPFSSKDELLGMKKGGAISQLLGEDRDKDRSSKSRWISNILGRSRDNIARLIGSSKSNIGKLLASWKKDKAIADRKQLKDGIHTARIYHAEPEGGSNRLAKLQISAIEISNNYLHQLVQLTQALVKKPAGGAGGNVIKVSKPDNSMPGTQGDPAGPSFADSRVEFYNSPYSMHTPGTLA